jgi:transmembrane sensor
MMDELLAKYIIGEANAAEVQTVEQWRRKSEYNEKYYAQFKLIWETTALSNTESNLDVDQSWDEFRELRNRSAATPAVPSLQLPRSAGLQQSNRSGWIKIAAVFISILGIAALWYAYLRATPAEMLTLQTFNEVKTDTLSDGSVITANKNSLLSYPAKFNGNTREVKLVRGEAFFSIAHNRSKPFLVHLNDAVVRVVGTSFNIINDKSHAEVIVETGIVEVKRNQVTLKLLPHEMVNINYLNGEVKKGLSTDNFYNYYRTKEFVANKTPLWRVAEVLTAVYKVNIEIPDPALANQTISTTFRMGELNQVLEIIASTFNAKIKHDKGRIIIQ